MSKPLYLYPECKAIRKAEREHKNGQYYKSRKTLEKRFKAYPADVKSKAVYYWLHTFAMTHNKEEYFTA